MLTTAAYEFVYYKLYYCKCLLYLVRVRALKLQFHIKNSTMHIFIIHAPLLTLCHSDMYQPSKAHFQGVGKIQFDIRDNKMIYQM